MGIGSRGVPRIFSSRTYLKDPFVHFSASTFMASYLQQFSAVMLFGTNLHYIWFEFSIIDAGTAPCKVAVWDEFDVQLASFGAKKVQILNFNGALKSWI